MGKLHIPLEDFAEIRTSPEMQAAINAETAEIAFEANGLAGTGGGYGTDINVGSDRARGHVWPQSGQAIRAESKSSPLMQVAARKGAQ